MLTWTDTTTVGRYPVTLRVTDDDGLFDEQAFAFVIQPGSTGDNTPPTITRTIGAGAQIPADREFTFAFEAVDPDGDVVTIQSADLPAGASLAADGTFAWTPTADQLGENSFTLIATDGIDPSIPVTVTLEVLAAGQDVPPVFTSNPVIRVVVGETYAYDSLAIDAGGETVAYFIDDVSQNRGMTIDSANGALTWDTTGVTPGDYPVTVTASDKPTIAGGLTDSQTFIVTVVDGATNTAPEFTSDPITTALAGGLYTYNARATDADNDSLVYGLISGPQGLQVNPISGQVQWIPTTSQLGQQEVQIAVADGRDGFDRQIFTIDIAGTNRPPRIDSSAPANAYVGETYTYQVEAVDPDNHSLTYSLAEPFTTADSNGDISIDTVTGLLTWTPDAVGTGSYQIQVNVVDSYGLGVGQSFSVAVLANRPNNPPRFVDANPTLSVEQGSIYRYTFKGFDPDDDDLTFRLDQAPGDAGINGTSGELTWDTANFDVNDLGTFKVVLTDGIAETYITYGVRVTAANQEPTLEMIDDESIIAGQSLRVDVYATDDPTQTLTYSLDDAAIAAGLTIDEYGRIEWTTDVTDVTTTPLNVLVTVSDGRLSVSDDFDITVSADTNGPDPVVITVDDASPNVGDEVLLRLFALDDVGVASRNLTLSSVTRGGETIPLNQSLALDNSGQTRLTITESMIGVLTFTGHATDTAANRTDAAPLQLTVVNPDDGAPPSVDLQVVDGTELTGVTNIFGSVSDDVPEDVRWSLSIQDNDTGVATSIARDVFGSIDAGLLGQVDATLLAAGAYTLTLSATDSGGRTPQRCRSGRNHRRFQARKFPSRLH